MGNHHIECEYCHEDTRGLSGVRGCRTYIDARHCSAYKKYLKDAPIPTTASLYEYEVYLPPERRKGGTITEWIPEAEYRKRRNERQLYGAPGYRIRDGGEAWINRRERAATPMLSRFGNSVTLDFDNPEDAARCYEAFEKRIGA